MTPTTNYVDKNMFSYKLAYESFGMIAVDQEPGMRMNYRNIAMEAVTGPEAGMLMEKLYKSVSSRANVNFGKIPDSCGDITAFTRYRQITESLDILRGAFATTKCPEFNETTKLHDNLIRLRDDFAYGFKMDSQFLKVTYNTMVYSLCEMINLVTVIYVDSLKAASEGKPFNYKPYNNLILVENVSKFNKMVDSGEWAQMMKEIRTGAKALTGADMDDMYGILRFFGIGTTLGTAGAGAKIIHKGWDEAKKELTQKLIDKGAKNTTPNAIHTGYTALKNKLWTKASTAGKVVTVIMLILGALFLIRSLICLYWRCKYSIREILDDNAKLLAASMEVSQDNTATSLEKQQKMYNKLVGLRDKMERDILSDDAQGKKSVHESNKTDMSLPAGSSATATAVDDAGGFSFG